MILVSFYRILKGLSDEINLLWRCSSPLKAFLECSPIISLFPKVSEIFRNIFRSNFQRFKFSVYFRFKLHVVQNILISKST